MGNKEWENYLRELLGDFKTGGDVPSWDDFVQPNDTPPDATDLPESLQDESLRENLVNYSPDDQVTGWERIEASLDAADREFDEALRQKINQFQPADDPHSWSVFLSRFSAHKLLRAKLITLKIFETAAMVLLLITLLHLGQKGKFAVFAPSVADTAIVGNEYEPDNASQMTAGGEAQMLPQITKTHPDKVNYNTPLKDQATEQTVTSTNSIYTSEPAGIQSSSGQTISPRDLASAFPEIADQGNDAEIYSLPEPLDFDQSVALAQRTQFTVLQSPTLPVSYLASPSLRSIPDPVFVKSVGKSFLEFGMLVQADYNQLKMPEDRVNSDGKQVVFPLQGITSPGYGAGFTLALGHPLWAVETGLIYSSKSFRPGRELTIGAGLNNSNVEFEAMRMQLISAPLQFRYRFEPKGRLKSYAIAGFGLHLITQSDIDVMVEYNFPSLNEGEDPNNVPSLARTIRQTQRVSEDIRKKAPFSSQSFISANLGVGMEYLLDEHKTLFLQTAYQYQVPNLRFSNHDGKHLLSLSFQAGVRTPLGN